MHTSLTCATLNSSERTKERMNFKEELCVCLCLCLERCFQTTLPEAPASKTMRRASARLAIVSALPPPPPPPPLCILRLLPPAPPAPPPPPPPNPAAPRTLFTFPSVITWRCVTRKSPNPHTKKKKKKTLSTSVRSTRENFSTTAERERERERERSLLLRGGGLPARGVKENLAPASQGATRGPTRSKGRRCVGDGRMRCCLQQQRPTRPPPPAHFFPLFACQKSKWLFPNTNEENPTFFIFSSFVFCPRGCWEGGGWSRKLNSTRERPPLLLSRSQTPSSNPSPLFSSPQQRASFVVCVEERGAMGVPLS